MDDWEVLDEETVDSLPCEAGLYIILSVHGGRPRVIRRVLGNDTSGILCIGRAGTRGLKNRLSIFLRAACDGRAPHSEGKTYCRCRYDEEGYPLDSLEFSWWPLRPRDAKQWERDGLQAYENVFGELPPLNKRCG